MIDGDDLLIVLILLIAATLHKELSTTRYVPERECRSAISLLEPLSSRAGTE